jgi:hypothetical protein
VRYWEIHSEIFSISSLVKISITWLLVFIQYFAWDYIINRTLHCGLKIWLLSSRVKSNILLTRCARSYKILLSPLEDKSHIFAPPCSILYIRVLPDEFLFLLYSFWNQWCFLQSEWFTGVRLKSHSCEPITLECWLQPTNHI